MAGKSMLTEEGWVATGRLLRARGGANTLYDRSTYEKRTGWSWPEKQAEEASALPPMTKDGVDGVARLTDGVHLRVEKLLFQANKVKGRNGGYQVLEVSADVKGEVRRGFIYSVYAGKEFVAPAGVEIDVSEGVEEELTLVVLDTAVGRVLAKKGDAATQATPIAPQASDPATDESSAQKDPDPADEARKYEILKGLILASRRWTHPSSGKGAINAAGQRYDYDSGAGSVPPIFREGPWEANVLGLRAWAEGQGLTDPASGTYCSTIYVLYKDDKGTPRCEHFAAALDCAPRRNDSANEEDYSGTATVLPGQYTFHQDCHPDFYRSDNAHRFPALDHDPHALWYHEASRRKGGPTNVLGSKWGTGIHIHAGRPTDSCRHTTTGCQIFWGSWTNWRYQRFLWLVSRGTDGAFLQSRVREIPYTLVDARKVDRAALEELKKLRPDAAEMKARGEKQKEKIGLKSYDKSSPDRFVWAEVSRFPSGTAPSGS